MEIEMNFAAVAAGAVAAMIMGAIWYSPIGFGNKWMKASGLSEKKAKDNEMKGMILSLVRSTILSFALYHIIYVTAQFYSQDSFIQNAIGVGAWVGIGLVGLSMLLHDTFDQRPKMLSKIHIGFEIVTILVVSIVIGLIAG